MPGRGSVNTHVRVHCSGSAIFCVDAGQGVPHINLTLSAKLKKAPAQVPVPKLYADNENDVEAVVPLWGAMPRRRNTVVDALQVWPKVRVHNFRC